MTRPGDDPRDDPRELSSAAGPDDVAPGQGAGDDPLVAVRAALEDVLELPLPERAEVFEEAHRVVVAELRALELG